VNIQFLILGQTLFFFSYCYEVGMGQKDFVRNVLFFKKNVWRRPLCASKGDSFTWDSGRTRVKSLDWIRQNRDL